MTSGGEFIFINGSGREQPRKPGPGHNTLSLGPYINSTEKIHSNKSKNVERDQEQDQ